MDVPSVLGLVDPGPLDPAGLSAMLTMLAERRDCADFRALGLVVLLGRHRDRLPGSQVEAIEEALAGFRWTVADPGSDDMCTWSENHQVVFAVGELLAGQQLARRVFTASGLTGRQHVRRAADRLRRWLELRARFGFSEWLSNTYYEEDVAALVALVDHADDPGLVEAARGVLDAQLVDLAGHCLGGRLVAASGRCYLPGKLDPGLDTHQLLAHLLEFPLDHVDPHRLSAIVLTGGYRAPRKAVEIAHRHDPGSTAAPLTTTSSHGLPAAAVSRLLPDPDQAAELAGSMEAFVHPATAGLLADWVRRHHLADNTFLRPLRPLLRLADLDRRLAAPAIRLLDPPAQGLTLEHATVMSWRSRHGLLSSTQRHQPGGFGDQQSLWQATLPGVAVFATHPGTAVAIGPDQTRNQTPGAWVGNGINPDVAQHGPLLLARHDLRRRRGIGPQPRPLSHLWWPADRFDEVRGDRCWLAGRVGDGFVGVRSAAPMRAGDGAEQIQPGRITGWGVRLGAGDFDRFVAELAASDLSVDRRRIRWELLDRSVSLDRLQGWRERVR